MAMATWGVLSPDEKEGILPPTKDLAESGYTLRSALKNIFVKCIIRNIKDGKFCLLVNKSTPI